MANGCFGAKAWPKPTAEGSEGSVAEVLSHFGWVLHHLGCVLGVTHLSRAEGMLRTQQGYKQSSISVAK